MIKTTCCIVGGGPAGMMLGYMLARKGIQVTVLEKHKDFFRDFRGDTVHPSTLQVMHELGLLEDFLKLPHQELASLGIVIGDFAFDGPDFRHLPTHSKFIALMPQWDFLNFLAEHAKRFPSFQLCLEHKATGFTRDGSRITGVQAETPGGAETITADLVVGCDGRHSITRQEAGFEVDEFGVPIDVLWFQIPRESTDPDRLGNVNYGKALVLINRGNYFQAGFIIRKGAFDKIREQGLEQFRQSLVQIAPHLSDRVQAIESWDQIKLLTVQLNRLKQWHRPGLLCIGDAAHAMSPAGGVGINLAIQDAVAAANILAVPLREKRVTKAVLAKVQSRRMFPTKATQAAQANAHRGLETIFRNPGPIQAPWQLKAVANIPGIQRVFGYMLGIGVRPEHVDENYGSAGAIKTVAVCGAILAGIAIAAKHSHQLRRKATAF